MKREVKVGLFIVIAVMVLAWVTINLRELSGIGGGGYTVNVRFASAQGIRDKTPVELAGIQIGVVKKVRLVNSREALVTLALDKDVVLAKDTIASVQSKGFLGETYIELVPGTSPERLQPGEQIIYLQETQNFNTLARQMSSIAEDMKVITSSIRENVEGENGRLNRILTHIESLTQHLSQFTEAHMGHFDQIAENLAVLSEDLRTLVTNNRDTVDATLERIANIAEDIDEGRGTLGKLVKDDETVEKLNESLDNLNDAIGGVNRLKTEIGYHVEYLGSSENLKHYVNLTLKPRPDKYFMFELIDDPAPDAKLVVEERQVTSGGTTSTVVTETETTNVDKFQFSAQIAKEFYDFTLRGGIIESSGGVGMDYGKGPFELSFNAFDFESEGNQNPHLKTWATLNVTKNFFVMSGADDFISNDQDPDWFVGAGIQFVDEDIKTLLGTFNLKP